MNKFEAICKMSQKTLKKYVTEELKKTYKDVVVDDGFVFAQGEFPVLLVAHMDTVHQKLPEVIIYNSKTKSLSSPQGIGGDDRCGVYMILEIIKKYNCSVLFCEDEEVGGVGARKFTRNKLTDKLKFHYILEFDRKGDKDAVFYDCDNEDFEEFITEEFYETAYGTFSDISIIAPELGCAAVNLSCGYYKAHTNQEYVVIPEMEASIEAACKILERTGKYDEYEYIEAKYSYNSFYSGYNDIEKYYIIEYVDKYGHTDWFDVCASSEVEAIGMFCIEYPQLTYNHIIDICVDNYTY